VDEYDLKIFYYR